MATGDVVVVPVRETAIMYRIVRGADRSAPAVLDSSTSHYARGAPPRGYERRLAVIHMGLSVLLSTGGSGGDGREVAGDRDIRRRVEPGARAWFLPR